MVLMRGRGHLDRAGQGDAGDVACVWKHRTSERGFQRFDYLWFMCQRVEALEKLQLAIDFGELEITRVGICPASSFRL